MVVKRLILKKVLQSGIVAEFLLVSREDEIEAALFVSGKYIGGPSLPQPLEPPRGEVTHWMGNRPSVGLTLEEAERIIEAVEVEKGMVEHQKKQGWA